MNPTVPPAVACVEDKILERALRNGENMIWLYHQTEGITSSVQSVDDVYIVCSNLVRTLV